MPARRRFTDAQWHEAFALGLGNKLTAQRLGCGEVTVLTNRKRLGYPSRPKTPVKAPRPCVQALVRIGWDAPRIANHFGVDQERVRIQARAGKLRLTRSPRRYPDWSNVDRLLRLQMSPTAIAAGTRKSLAVVCERRRSLGLPPRPRAAMLHRSLEERRAGVTIAPEPRPPDDGAGVAGAGCIVVLCVVAAQEAA